MTPVTDSHIRKLPAKHWHPHPIPLKEFHRLLPSHPLQLGHWLISHRCLPPDPALLVYLSQFQLDLPFLLYWNSFPGFIFIALPRNKRSRISISTEKPTFGLHFPAFMKFHNTRILNFKIKWSSSVDSQRTLIQPKILTLLFSDQIPSPPALVLSKKAKISLWSRKFLTISCWYHAMLLRHANQMVMDTKSTETSQGLPDHSYCILTQRYQKQRNTGKNKNRGKS